MSVISSSQALWAGSLAGSLLIGSEAQLHAFSSSPLNSMTGEKVLPKESLPVISSSLQPVSFYQKLLNTLSYSVERPYLLSDFRFCICKEAARESNKGLCLFPFR